MLNSATESLTAMSRWPTLCQGAGKAGQVPPRRTKECVINPPRLPRPRSGPCVCEFSSGSWCWWVLSQKPAVAPVWPLWFWEQSLPASKPVEVPVSWLRGESTSPLLVVAVEKEQKSTERCPAQLRPWT